MKFKRILSAAAILCFMTVNASAADNSAVPTAPQSAEITQSGGLLNIDLGSDDAALLDKAEGEAAVLLGEIETYNNDISNLSYVTDVKSQGSYNTCWAFSSTSCLESALLKKKGLETVSDSSSENSEYNFSELHTALALSENFLKDDTYGYIGIPSDLSYGGNGQMTAMYVTRAEADNTFTGPVYESGLSYDKAGSASSVTAGEMALDTAGYYPAAFTALDFKNTYLSDTEISERNELIKDLVKEYGSVSVSVYCGATSSSSSQGFIKNSSGKYVFYQNNTSRTSNHAVTIVGYDDSFSSSNFSDFSSYLSAGDDSTVYASTPSINGAFIVRNSWGSSWGNSGYFYMSYGTYINRIYAFGNMTSRDTYDFEYDYTPYLIRGSVGGYYNTDNEDLKYIYAANDFEKKSEKPEMINKISVYLTKGDTEIKLYTDSDGGHNKLTEVKAKACEPEEGLYAYEVNDDCIYVPYPGNYVFELEEPVLVTGDSFSAAVYVSHENTENEGTAAALAYEADYTSLVEHDESNASYFSYSPKGLFSTMKTSSGEEIAAFIRAYTYEVDAAGLLKHLSGIKTDDYKYSKADINGDGSVDLLDVTAILKAS